MKILHKHIAREILIPFVLAFVVMTFLTLVGDLLQELAQRFTNEGLGFADIGMIGAYVIPMMMVYTIPIALLFATLAAYVQFSQDCEIVAMQAAGVSIRKAFAPAILIGSLATLVLLPINVEISPWARRELKLFIIDTVLERPTLMLTEQAWTPEINDMRIFVGEIDETEMTLRDINILVSKDDGPNRTIVSESGRISIDKDSKKVFFQLDNGSIHEYDQEQPDKYSTTTFSSLKIPVNVAAIDDYVEDNRKYRELSMIRRKEKRTRELVGEILDPATDPKERIRAIGQIGRRTAMAFMPLTFVLIGAPLGIIPYKSRRFYGFAICGLLLLAYYALLMLGESLSKGGVLNPLVAMWVPNLLLGSTGVGLMIRAERR